MAKHAKGLEFLMKKNKVETIRGYGKLTGPAQNGVLTVEVTARMARVSQVKAKNVILSHRLGSPHAAWPRTRATHPDQHRNSRAQGDSQIAGDCRRGGGRAWSSLPSSRSFGAEVTIIEMLPRLVPVEDEEVSKELARVYRKRGINFHTGAKVEKIEKSKVRNHRNTSAWMASSRRSKPRKS